MELLDALSQTFAHATEVMAGVGPDQLDAPTPCREWTVRDLVAHTTGVVINMGRGASGRALLPDVNAVALDTDLGAQFRVESDRTLAAWTARGSRAKSTSARDRCRSRPGSASTCSTPPPTPGTSRARTVKTLTLPDELAVTALSVARGIVNDDTRQFAGIDPAIAVAEDASATDQLVAFLGRRP